MFISHCSSKLSQIFKSLKIQNKIKTFVGFAVHKPNQIFVFFSDKKSTSEYEYLMFCAS